MSHPKQELEITLVNVDFSFSSMVKELNTAAQKIAAGDFSVTISHQAMDEVGTLADSFGHDFGYMLMIDASKLICKVFKRSPIYRAILENGDLEHGPDILENFQADMKQQNK